MSFIIINERTSDRRATNILKHDMSDIDENIDGQGIQFSISNGRIARDNGKVLFNQQKSLSELKGKVTNVFK